MADWKIIDGNPPYLDDFPTIATKIDEYPNTFWRMADGDMPYKTSYPVMHPLDDAPSSLWKIKDGEIPYRNSYPKLSGITDAPSAFWILQDGDTAPKKSVYPGLHRPVKERTKKYKKFTILLSSYNETIVLRKDVM